MDKRTKERQRRLKQRLRGKGKLPEWRYTELITSLGTANEIIDRMKIEGLAAPPRLTILGWRQRNSIPARWLPLMIQWGIQDMLLKGIHDLRKNP